MQELSVLLTLGDFILFQIIINYSCRDTYLGLSCSFFLRRGEQDAPHLFHSPASKCISGYCKPLLIRRGERKFVDPVSRLYAFSIKMAPPPATYHKDERVLCFHHEILYEAKILDVRHTDPEDKKSPLEYAVHYKGWKNTYVAIPLRILSDSILGAFLGGLKMLGLCLPGTLLTLSAMKIIGISYRGNGHIGVHY